MKAFPKSVAVVAVSNLLCFWIVYGLLTAVRPHPTPSQFLGFAPSPSPSHWLSFLAWTFGILGAPVSITLDGVSSRHIIMLLVLSSILNAAIWGGLLGFPLRALAKRFRNAAA